ncbi:MAG: InlB B-repeat-containing protein [Candidatus Ancillula sp.]|nr:InlB B-repeat-containing protein [Candidatus Ancillula sp.]
MLKISLKKCLVGAVLFGIVLTFSLGFVVLNREEINVANAAAGSDVSFGDYSLGDSINLGGLKFDIAGGHTVGSSAESAIGMCGDSNANKCADNSAYLLLDYNSESIQTLDSLASATGSEKGNVYPNIGMAYPYSNEGNNDYSISIARTILSEKFTSWTNNDFAGEGDIIPRTLFQGELDTALGENCTNSSCNSGDVSKIKGDNWWLPSVNEAQSWSNKNDLGQSWWFRSPGSASYDAAVAASMSAGVTNIESGGANVSSYNALRPALLLSLSSPIFKKLPAASDLNVGYCEASSSQCVQIGDYKFDVIGLSSDSKKTGLCTMGRTDGYLDYTLPNSSTNNSDGSGNAECPLNSAMLLLSNSSSSKFADAYFNNNSSYATTGCGSYYAKSDSNVYSGSVLQACMETDSGSAWNLIKNQKYSNYGNDFELSDFIITRSLTEYSTSVWDGNGCSTADQGGCLNGVYNSLPTGILNQHLFPLSTAEACAIHTAACNDSDSKDSDSSNALIYTDWWLRSVGTNTQGNTVGTAGSGHVYPEGASMDSPLAVRPAMFISLSSVNTSQLVANVDLQNQKLSTSETTFGQTTVQNDHHYAYSAGATQDGMSSAANPVCTAQADEYSGAYFTNSVKPLSSWFSDSSDQVLRIVDCGEDGTSAISSVLNIVLPRISYTVDFVSNGGTSIENQTLYSGDKVAEPQNPKKEHYEFAGWYSDLLLSKPYDFAAPIDDSFTLYAKWAINTYQVTFEFNNYLDFGSEIINYGDKVTEPVNPTYNGYVFQGWYSDSDFNNLYDFSTPVTKDITLYAKWIVYIPPKPVDPTCLVTQHLSNHVCVDNQPTSLTLNKSTINLTTTINGRKTFKIVANLISSDGQLASNQSSLTFSSSDKSIATVDNSGKITAIKVGVVTVKVKAKNSLAKDCKVIVGLPQLYKYKSQLSDISSQTKEFQGYIKWMYSYGVTTGDGEGHFMPSNFVRRDQMAMFIYRLMGNPDYANKVKNFSDVSKSNISYNSVMWLVNNGITTGMDKTIYYPAGNVTRLQMALFMYRLAGSPTESTSNIYKVSDWNKKWPEDEYKMAINFMFKTGTSTGSKINKKTYYMPNNYVTRAQMAAFMNRLYNNSLIK